MLIERIWAANDLRNFQYLVACSETGEALVIDPLEGRQCLDAARARGFTTRQILNTHEHLRSHRGQRGRRRGDSCAGPGACGRGQPHRWSR